MPKEKNYVYKTKYCLEIMYIKFNYVNYKNIH